MVNTIFLIFLEYRRRLLKIKGARSGIIILRDNQILLIHRFWRGREYFVIPGGGVEPGETPEEAAIREAKEETGLDVTLRKKLFEEFNEYDSRQQHYFLSDSFQGNVELGGEEAKKNGPTDKYILEWHDISKICKIPLVPESLKDYILINFRKNS